MSHRWQWARPHLPPENIPGAAATSPETSFRFVSELLDRQTTIGHYTTQAFASAVLLRQYGIVSNASIGMESGTFETQGVRVAVEGCVGGLVFSVACLG